MKCAEDMKGFCQKLSSKMLYDQYELQVRKAKLDENHDKEYCKALKIEIAKREIEQEQLKKKLA